MMRTNSLARILVVAVAVAVLVVAPRMAKAEISPRQCKEERNQLVNECRPVLFGQNPSANCCQHVRVVHVECICPFVKLKLDTLINAGRLAKQIRGCGRNLPHNFKCGSITFP